MAQAYYRWPAAVAQSRPRRSWLYRSPHGREGHQMDSELKTLSHAQATLTDMVLRFGPKLLVAVLILAVGLVVGRWVARGTERCLHRLALEPPVRLLLVRLVRWLVLGLFAIMALQN